jgi:uncharacterized protein (TIGR02302 family)
VKVTNAGWQKAIKAYFSDWRKTRPRRLTRLAQGALALERFARASVPTVVVIGFFIALSWTGVWLGAPTFLRILGVAALIGVLVAALMKLREFHWPDAAQARDALDIGDANAPAAALADSLANSEDSRTQALWRLHQRRAERLAGKLRPVIPSPRLWTVDRYALGALAVLALCGASPLAGPEKYARVAAAFDWRWRAHDGALARIDAWIDPPAYTAKPPIVLPLHNPAATPGPFSAPSGSTVVVRAANAPGLRVTAQGGVEAAPMRGAADATSTEKRFLLRGDGRLKIEDNGGEVAEFALSAILDQPPKITLLGPPQTNLHGSFVLGYRIDDDYGVRDATVSAEPKLGASAANARPLFEPPSGALDLPNGAGGLGEAKTTIDWSDSPYSGVPVALRFRVHDDGGNEGQAVIPNYVLPGKVFKNPLALSLAEQRRILALDAREKGRVLEAIDALMINPETFTPDPGIYLGLRFIHDSLRDSRNDADLVAVVEILWELALRIEDGDAPQAERDLRAAESALRDALKRGASPEEIAKLTEQLQKALDQYLSALQQKAAKNGKAGESENGDARSVTPKDLQSMLDQLAQAAKNGDKDAAMELLDQMRDTLENLRASNQSDRAGQAARDRRTMRDIDNLMREQQKLRDDTYSHDHGDPKGFEPPDEAAQGNQDQRRRDRDKSAARSPRNKDNQGQGNESSQDQNETGAPNELSRRQQRLGEKLNALRQRSGGEADKKSEGLAEAADAMQQAEKALKSGNDEAALAAQGRALDGLRKGAEEIAQKGGENGPSDSQEEGGEKKGQGLRGQNGEGRFGRANKQNNIDPTAVQNARKVLEELRHRLSDPSRSQEELDYLERLIKPD